VTYQSECSPVSLNALKKQANHIQISHLYIHTPGILRANAVGSYDEL